MSKKMKWTLIDTLIVVLVIVAGVTLFNVFSPQSTKGNTKTIEVVVLLSQEEPEVAGAMHTGDTITISLTEKDTGILKDVEPKDATTVGFNAIDGTYTLEPVEGKVDIYATIELEVTENEFALACGSSIVKVGNKLPVHGKGYALSGFVVEINERG